MDIIEGGTMDLTQAQRAAIAEQETHYGDPAYANDVRHVSTSIAIGPNDQWSSPEGYAVASFTYRYMDDDLGQTGLEVTVFAPDGSVHGSQDFG